MSLKQANINLPAVCLVSSAIQADVLRLQSEHTGMTPTYSRPLQFSDCHGCNVVLTQDRTFAEGKYIKAHGQFISQAPLVFDQPFELVLTGTGIIKFNTFPSRAQAVEWVRSNQPLPRGCRRIRMAGSIKYTLTIPHPGQCVLVECVRASKRELFTLPAGSATTLAFDIEYGDISVSVGTSISGVAFDTFCCSSHIDISNTLGVSSATLCHYNPSSLCCLEDTPLESGAIFRLDVIGSQITKDTGSYIRIGVAKQLALYENNGLVQCFATVANSRVNGRRILIAPGIRKQLFIYVVPEGLRIYKKMGSKVMDIVMFELKHCHTLWFELHKVSLRVFQVFDHVYCEPKTPSTTSTHDTYEQPIPLIAPPLPPRPPNRGRYISRVESKHIPTKQYRNRELAGICNDGYHSETPSSNSKEGHPPVSGKGCASYVSGDRLGPSAFGNNTTNVTDELSYLSHSGFITQNCICDVSLGSTPLISPELDLFALFSKESLNVECGQRNQQIQTLKFATKESQYEIPEAIWPKQKSKYLNSKAKNSGEMTIDSLKPVQNCSKLKASQGPIHYHSRKNGELLDRKCFSPSGADFVKENLCHECSQMCTLLRHPRNVNRTKACHLKDVTDIRDVLLSENNNLLAEECHLERSRRTPDSVINGEYNDKCDQSNLKVLQWLSRDSKAPTSSVWLRDTDDNESVRHDLEISFKPVQGQLRCRSYHSDIRNSQTESRLILAEPREVLERFSPPSNQPINDNARYNSGHETTLKAVYSGTHSKSSDSDFDDYPTASSLSSDTPLKGGYTYGTHHDNVDDEDSSDDASDEITNIKRLATRESSHLTETSCLSETDTLMKHLRDKLPPKPCLPHSSSEYLLAAPLFPEQSENRCHNTKSKSSISKTNHSERESSESDDSINDWADTSVDSSDSCESLTLTAEKCRENALKEQAVSSDSGVVSLRYNWIRNRRNITESIISNSSAVILSVGPTIQLPCGTQNSVTNAQLSLKRTETLERNLDTPSCSPTQKVCGLKIV